jgi:hypothetical protein
MFGFHNNRGIVRENPAPVPRNLPDTDYLFFFVYLDIINNIDKMFTLGRFVNFVITK